MLGGRQPAGSRPVTVAGRLIFATAVSSGAGWVYPLQQHALHLATRRDLPGTHIAAKGIEPLGLGNFARRIYLVVSGGTLKHAKNIHRGEKRVGEGRRLGFGLWGEALSQLSCRQHNTLHPLTIPESNKCRTSRRSVLVGPAMVAN